MRPGRLLAMLASSWFAVSTVGAVDTASEQSVRAAMVYNFLKFAEWPAMPDDPDVLICVSTSDQQLAAAMDALRERTVRGKQVTTTSFAGQADCDVVYVDSRQRWHRLAEQQTSRRALTIGGYPGFVADGGIVEVAFHDGQVRFDVNLREAKRAGLRFYPQLLRLARRVVE